MDRLGWSVIGALAGLIAGSFLAALAVRWGRGESIARGRSRCDGCARPLAPAELVPLAAYLVLGGRCRTCRAPIDPRQPLLELACAAIGALALWSEPGGAGAAGALFGWLLATLALLDVDHLWLPDRLTLPLAAAGLLAGRGASGDRFAGLAAGIAALALLRDAYGRWRGREGLGLGDAKLLGAIGAWLGWRPLPWVVLAAACLGLLWCAGAMLRGARLSASQALPLGALLAIAAWPAWLAAAPSMAP